MKKSFCKIGLMLAACSMVPQPLAAPAETRAGDSKTAAVSREASEAYNRALTATTTEARMMWLNMAIQSDPGFALAYQQRGVTYRLQGDLNNAVKDFSRLIELEPERGEGYYLRGTVYGELRKDSQAIEDLSRAIALPSGSGWLQWAHVNRASAYLRRNRYELALLDLGKALAIEPDFAEAYCVRSRVYAARRDLHSALNDLNQALLIKPELPEAYALRASIHTLLRHYNKAWNDVKMCWRLGGMVQIVLVEALLTLDERQVARDPWPTGWKAPPEHPTPLWQPSPAIIIGSDAKAFVRQSRQPAPARHTPAVQLFEAFVWSLEARTPDEKIAACDRMIQLAPDLASAYSARGCAYFNKDDYARAISDFDRALQLEPRTPAFLNNRALARAKQGD